MAMRGCYRKKRGYKRRFKKRGIHPSRNKLIPYGVSNVGYFDNAVSGETITSTMQYDVIFLPTRGANYNLRLMEKTVLLSVQMKGQIYPGPTQTTPQAVRLLLVWDVQPNSALPSSPLPLTASTPFAYVDPNWRNRFKVLYDEQWVIPGSVVALSTAAVPDNKETCVKFFRKCRLESTYGGNSGVISDISTGALLLIRVGDSAAPTPTFTYSTRCRFVH